VWARVHRRTHLARWARRLQLCSCAVPLPASPTAGTASVAVAARGALTVALFFGLTASCVVYQWQSGAPNAGLSEVVRVGKYSAVAAGPCVFSCAGGLQIRRPRFLSRASPASRMAPPSPLAVSHLLFTGDDDTIVDSRFADALGALRPRDSRSVSHRATCIQRVTDLD